MIQWLLEGVSVRDVEARLRELYPHPNQEHLRISFSALQVFRKVHLQLEDQVLDDIKEATSLTRENIRNEVVQAEVMKTSAYREKINTIVDEQLQAQREIVKTFTLIEGRLQKLYDRAESLSFTDHKLEKLLQTYFEQMLKTIDSYKKYVDGHRDSTDINVTVNVATEHVNTLREVVREVLSEVDPQLAIQFMDKLNRRLRTLTPLEQDVEGALVVPGA